MTTALVRAETGELNFYTVTPGLLGFVVVAALGLATWALLRSMVRHLRTAREALPSGCPGAPREGGGAPAEAPGEAPPVSRRGTTPGPTPPAPGPGAPERPPVA